MRLAILTRGMLPIPDVQGMKYFVARKPAIYNHLSKLI